MARGYRITWKGKAATPSDAQLTALHQALQANNGWTAAGAPVRRTWGGDGLSAVALYREAMIAILCSGGWCYATAMIRGTVDIASLNASIAAALLLTDTTTIEDQADL